MTSGIRSASGFVLDAGAVVSDVVNVPGVGSVVDGLQSILRRCEQVATNKRETAHLADTCRRYIDLLRDRTILEHDEATRVAVDELEGVLSKILRKLDEYTTRTSFRRFMRNTDISSGLRRCQNQLDAGMKSFQTRAQLHVIGQLYQHAATRDSHHGEVIDLLTQILNKSKTYEELSPVEAVGVMKEGNGGHAFSRISAPPDAELRRRTVQKTEEPQTRSPTPTPQSPVTPSYTSQQIPPPMHGHAAEYYHSRQQQPWPSPQYLSHQHNPAPMAGPSPTSQQYTTTYDHDQAQAYPQGSYSPSSPHDMYGQSSRGFLQPPLRNGARTPSPYQPDYYRDEAASGSSMDVDRPPSPRPSYPSFTDPAQYLELQRRLFELHSLRDVLPAIKILNGEVSRENEYPVAGGPYTDVWTGWWLGVGAKKVALKSLRMVQSNDKAKKRFRHEIEVWSGLKHINISPFYGLVTDYGQHIQVVSAWAENGNVLQYIAKYPHVNRLQLMYGASKGLTYLHDCKVVHGNVRCNNILVSEKGIPLVCDFGMSKVIEDVTETVASATLTTSGSARWLAPELIEGTTVSPTFESDVYSFGMTMLECVTGKHPYAHCKRDAVVIFEVVSAKKSPPRPSGPDYDSILTDEWWSAMGKCWLPAAQRPDMIGVATLLQACPHPPSMLQ